MMQTQALSLVHRELPQLTRIDKANRGRLIAHPHFPADDPRGVAFLQAGLPVINPPKEYDTWLRPWPDWRHGDPGELRDQLGWPVEGALLDVKRNAFWRLSWGPRPAGLDDALDTARRHLAQAPQMIPVYAHRFLPGGHGSHGHPVLSIWKTDIIVYGTDLADYINQEFACGELSIEVSWAPPELVSFWGDFVRTTGT